MSDEPVKGMKELEDNDPLSEAYMNLLTTINELVQEHDVLDIAAIMMTQALSLYRTALSSEDYDKIVEGIINFKDQVIVFDEVSTGRLH